MADNPHEKNVGPFSKRLSDASTDLPVLAETEFEKARGVNRLEIRTGFCSVHIHCTERASMAARLDALRSVFEAGVSIDFLKLTTDGLSFVMPDDSHHLVEAALGQVGVKVESRSGMAVLMAYAVSMRDEAGMVASIVSQVIASGASVVHMGDMHDRLLLLMTESEATNALASLKRLHPEALS